MTHADRTPSPDESPRDGDAPWYRQAFAGDYVDIYGHRDLNEAYMAVLFLQRVLGLRRDHRLLDLCCGPGRHLGFLCQSVGAAVGLDLSMPLLRHAWDRWREVGCAAPAPRLVRATMRLLPFAPASFDRVINMFTSFGYYEDEARNQAVLDGVARVLTGPAHDREPGLFALDHINRDWLLAGLEPRSEAPRPDGTRIVQERHWDAAAGRVVKHVQLLGPDGAARGWHESVRVYTVEELEGMLRRAGLEPLARHGGYEGQPWTPDSPRMILIARRGG